MKFKYIKIEFFNNITEGFKMSTYVFIFFWSLGIIFLISLWLEEARIRKDSGMLKEWQKTLEKAQRIQDMDHSLMKIRSEELLDFCHMVSNHPFYLTYKREIQNGEEK